MIHDAPTTYSYLVLDAAAFYRQHGTVDIVALAKAAELGVDVETFAADVDDIVTADQE